MSCSPMLSAGNLIPGQLATICQHLELNASLAERVTQMEEFTSMLLLTSDRSFDQERSMCLMLGDAIRMSRLVKVALVRAGTMRRKMATLLLGDWSDQTEAMFLQLALNGVKSALQGVSKSFGVYVRHWLLEHCLLTSHHYEHTLLGGFDQSEMNMCRLGESPFTRKKWEDLMRGYETMWVNLEEVSLTRHYGGSPPAASR